MALRLLWVSSVGLFCDDEAKKTHFCGFLLLGFFVMKRPKRANFVGLCFRFLLWVSSVGPFCDNEARNTYFCRFLLYVGLFCGSFL